MVFQLPDWVWETTTSTGTGAVTLAGAVSGYRPFNSQLADGDTCYYSMWDGTNFEEGIGTYASAGNTITRTTVYRSTNSNAAVSWGAGTKQIACAPMGATIQSLLYVGSTGVPYRSSDNVWNYTGITGGGGCVFNTNPTITQLVLGAGTVSAAPLTYTSGTNLTTAAAGATEYDGTVFYNTNNASNRGVAPSVQYILNNSNTRTLTSQTAAQAAFNSPTNGTLTLPVGLFEFEGYFELSAMSATSGSFGFALGGTATKTQGWMATALKNAAGAAGATPGVSWNTTAANTTLVTANTTTTGWFYVRGTFRITVAGTIIPQISLGVASAAVVGANSYFKVQQISSNTARSIGNWS